MNLIQYEIQLFDNAWNQSYMYLRWFQTSTSFLVEGVNLQVLFAVPKYVRDLSLLITLVLICSQLAVSPRYVVSSSKRILLD